MAIVGIVLFALLLLAVPIGIALSSAAAAFIIGDPLLETTVIFRQFFSFIARYSLTAIPLFIFAGFLMEKTGLIRQLFSFADALVGHLPGGFGVATVIACVLFGAISGSSVAMAAAMSGIAIMMAMTITQPASEEMITALTMPLGTDIAAFLVSSEVCAEAS